MEALLPILKDFGFPIALCAALLWAISVQNKQLVKSYTDRINTLEKVVRELTEKVDQLEADRIRRADEYGHTLKDIALRWAASARETAEVIRTTLAVTRRLCDSIAVRPCMVDGYHPHPSPRPPTSEDVPQDPSKVPTDRLHSHG